MWRTAVRPRWLALLALVIAVMAGFGFLGSWQLGVARDTAAIEAAREAAQRPEVPVQQVIGPHEPFPTAALSRPVSAVGSYRHSDHVLITDRKLGDRVGYWLVDALVLDEGGGIMPVLRGFVTDPQALPPAPSGRVEVHGTLAVGEPSPDEYRHMPPGQLQRLNTATLVNLWPGDLYNAFVFAADEIPLDGSTAVAPAGLERVPPPPPDSGGFTWRNLGYALQWWFFAGFAIYMWWRMVREDHKERTGQAVPDGHDAQPAPIPSDPTSAATARPLEGEPSR